MRRFYLLFITLGLLLSACAKKSGVSALENDSALTASEAALETQTLASSAFNPGEEAPGGEALVHRRALGIADTDGGFISGPTTPGGNDSGSIPAPGSGSASTTTPSTGTGGSSTGGGTSSVPTVPVPPASGGSSTGGSTTVPGGTADNGSSNPPSGGTSVPTVPGGTDGGVIAGPVNGGTDGGTVGGTIPGPIADGGSTPVPDSGSGSVPQTPGSNTNPGDVADNGSGGMTPVPDSGSGGSVDNGGGSSSVPVPGGSDGGAIPGGSSGNNDGGVIADNNGGNTDGGSTGPIADNSGNTPPIDNSGGSTPVPVVPGDSGNGSGSGSVPTVPGSGSSAGNTTPGGTVPGGNTDGGTIPNSGGGSTDGGVANNGGSTPPSNPADGNGNSGGTPANNGGGTTPSTPGGPVADNGSNPPGGGTTPTTPDNGSGGTTNPNTPNPGDVADNDDDDGDDVPGGGCDNNPGQQNPQNPDCSCKKKFKVVLSRICSVRRSGTSNLFFEDAKHPILSVEAKLSQKDMKKAPRILQNLLAGFGLWGNRPNVKVVNSQSGSVLVASVSLAAVDLFKGKYRTELELAMQGVKDAFGRRWKKSLVSMSVCEDSNQDGICSTESTKNQLAVEVPSFRAAHVPHTIEIDVWSGRYLTKSKNPEMCEMQYSPLVLDLKGNGIGLVGPESGVKFDLNDTGEPVRTGWTAKAKDDAFLVRDLDKNGKIDSGAELFGSATVLQSGKRAANGFEALKDLDSDGDGAFTKKDAAWNEVDLWIDSDMDGVADRNEMYPLDRAQITKINLSYVDMLEIDQYGNQTRQRSTYSRKVNGQERPFLIVDVWFNTFN